MREGCSGGVRRDVDGQVMGSGLDELKVGGAEEAWQTFVSGQGVGVILMMTTAFRMRERQCEGGATPEPHRRAALPAGLQSRPGSPIYGNSHRSPPA